MTTVNETAIPFIDLKAQQDRIRPALDAAIAKVLDHGQYIMGPEVKEFENDLNQFVGSKHCISVSNGTDALVMALMALGIGPGDAVITTPFTFFATVESIMTVGATPVFADIDPDSFNICPTQIESAIAQIQSKNELKLRAIMTVDLFGLCADYAAINALAEKHGLTVIQDSAQGFGSTCGMPGRAPVHGHIGTTSFFPAKPLGCYGDGGAVFTDDEQLAEIIRSIRVHGKGTHKYDNVRVGQNARLDTIQAAILLEKLRIYPDELQRRGKAAGWYAEQIANLNTRCGEELVNAPQHYPGFESAWAQYTIRVADRESIAARMKEQGVPTSVFYRTPSHLLKACQPLGYKAGDFPVSEQAANNVLSLPFHPYLEAQTVERVCNSLQSAVKNS